MTFQIGILVNPAAYETRSDDVRGLTLRRKISQTPCRSNRSWMEVILCSEKNLLIHSLPKLLSAAQQTPLPKVFPRRDSKPPLKPPNIKPPGPYSIKPGKGAIMTSMVTHITYTKGAACPKDSKNCLIFSILMAAGMSVAKMTLTIPPCSHE